MLLKLLKLKITAKTGGADKLFGSISNADLADVWQMLDQSIDRKFISIAGGTIKRTGKYTASVRLHREVIVELPFEIVAEVN